MKCITQNAKYQHALSEARLHLLAAADIARAAGDKQSLSWVKRALDAAEHASEPWEPLVLRNKP